MIQDLMTRSKFIDSYVNAPNASTGSQVDPNANVTQKTIATLESEMYKPYTIMLNRERLRKYMSEEDYTLYRQMLDDHLIYTHDETNLKPYCASISLTPFMLEGTKCIGGVSGAPTNLQSFCGSFVNFVYQVASNFAGAVATVEFLHCFDYFARKQYGENYLLDNRKEVLQELQGVVYALNQPSSARGDQSVFWNISVFDEPYFKAMFGTSYYPDGTQPKYETVRMLQTAFMEWFRLERRKELLTFPVVTASHLIDPVTTEYVDKSFLDVCTYEMSKGLSFFIYVSSSADSLASCCRLRNELADNTFSYSLGAGGVVTGSAQVITINMYRVAVYSKKVNVDYLQAIKEISELVQSFLMAHRKMFQDYIKGGLLPVYTAGIMNIDRQFLTIGLNGIVEAAEEFGFTASNNYNYKQFLGGVLKVISDANKEQLHKTKIRFNTEFVPAENLGVKFAKWDKEELQCGARSKCYNSYFYRPEGNDDIYDKMVLFGREVTHFLDGGSALHLNLSQLLTKKQAKTLYEMAANIGVPYWTFNVLSTCCNDCGFINPETTKSCAKCGSKNVDYATRIIGYLKRISNFSSARQVEAGLRRYTDNVSL